MRRPMVLLSLIVALTGTPLRLAEAASDLARSLEEMDDGWNIEEIDGGVGDDSGATLKANVAHAPDAMATPDGLPEPLELIAARPMIARSEDGPSGGPPSGPPSRRCALLQRFRC